MKIAVVGGGITGLVAAYELQKKHHEVTVFESGTILGGLASGFKEPDWSWSVEKYYHHWFHSDHAILNLIEELDCSKKILFYHPQTVSSYRNNFFPLDSPKAVLTFPGFSFTDKVRFGMVTAYLKFLANWPPLEFVTAQAWLIKWYGLSLYQKIWQPLLEGKFGPYAGQVNMAWMWSRLKARTATLGTYQGGFQAFIDDFVAILKQKGVILKTAASIRTIVPATPQGIILQLGTRQLLFDKVLVTTSPPILARLAPTLPKKYLQSLLKLKHLGAIVAVFSLSRPLSPQKYYWYNLPKSSHYPFLALVEHTNFISRDHFGGDTIVYCGDYAPVSDPRFFLTKTQIINQYLPVFSRINPDFKPDWVKKVWINRTDYAQPIPLVNHSRNLPSFRSPISGLYYAGMSHIYPWDRGTNYAVALGQKIAGLMSQDE